MVKIYECAICKRLVDNMVRGNERFISTRKDVRKHLVEIHNVKGRSRWFEKRDRDFTSRISNETLSRDWK